MREIGRRLGHSRAAYASLMGSACAPSKIGAKEGEPPSGRHALCFGFPNSIRSCRGRRHYELSYYLPKAIVPYSAWMLRCEPQTDGVFRPAIGLSSLPASCLTRFLQGLRYFQGSRAGHHSEEVRNPYEGVLDAAEEPAIAYKKLPLDLSAVPNRSLLRQIAGEDVL